MGFFYVYYALHRLMVKDICSVKRISLSEKELEPAARDNWK